MNKLLWNTLGAGGGGFAAFIFAFTWRVADGNFYVLFTAVLIGMVLGSFLPTWGLSSGTITLVWLLIDGAPQEKPKRLIWLPSLGGGLCQVIIWGKQSIIMTELRKPQMKGSKPNFVPTLLGYSLILAFVILISAIVAVSSPGILPKIVFLSIAIGGILFLILSVIRSQQ